MKITKYGHSCLLVEDKDARVIIDPGYLSSGQNEVKNVDAVLITHEHPDHLDLGSLGAILSNNTEAKIITNLGVGKILEKESITYQVLGHNKETEIKGIKIRGWGEKHAVLYPTIPQVDNTGYIINKKFFHPGDSFAYPVGSVDILALPLAGPWLKLLEAIDLAKEIKPRVAFPIHDGILKNPASIHKSSGDLLTSFGINFNPIQENESLEF